MYLMVAKVLEPDIRTVNEESVWWLGGLILEGQLALSYVEFPHSDIYRWAIVFFLDRLADGLDAPRLGILSLTKV